MAQPDVHQFSCLTDNYGVLVHDADADVTVAIDAPDADAVLAALAQRGWKLTHILNTHHHGDHTGGNVRLKAETGCRVIGPKAEADRIPGIDEGVGEGDVFKRGDLEVRVLETPGHTIGHVTYWLPAANIAFTGDTLFSLGAGRIFEGNAEMMWNSLKKIMALPPVTQIYCGHEYTLTNARFAVALDPQNDALKTRAAEVEKLRADKLPTLPTSLGVELATNPFLRAHVPAIRRRLGLIGDPDWRVFAEIRARKNKF